MVASKKKRYKFNVFEDDLKNEVLNNLLSEKKYYHITLEEAIDITNCIVRLLDYNVFDAKKLLPKAKIHKIIVK